MASRVYSAEFFNLQGAAGLQAPVVVPLNRVYIVRQLTAFAKPIAGTLAVYFKDAGTGATFWYRSQTAFGTMNELESGLHIVFPSGAAFTFDVSASFGDAADIGAWGYSLTTP